MTDPVLYILMRNDLASMNPGKAMAQASHASNAFVKHVESLEDGCPEAQCICMSYAWKNETPQGFGTVLVLGLNEDQMNSVVKVAQTLNFVSGVINDPSYPLVDGDTVHFMNLDTCGYVFGDKNDPVLVAILQNFNLHP